MWYVIALTYEVRVTIHLCPPPLCLPLFSKEQVSFVKSTIVPIQFYLWHLTVSLGKDCISIVKDKNEKEEKIFLLPFLFSHVIYNVSICNVDTIKTNYAIYNMSQWMGLQRGNKYYFKDWHSYYHYSLTNIALWRGTARPTHFIELANHCVL